MKVTTRVSRWMAGLIAILFVVSCQNSIMDSPLNSTAIVSESSIQLVTVKANQGFAKQDVFSHSRMIPAHRGGTLGGPQTGGNYVQIPPGALEENTFFTFTCSVENGAPIFEIEARNQEGRIVFQDGKTATLVLSSDWVNESPDVLVNMENYGDFVDVTEDGGFYVGSVTHFSKWSWGILE